MATKRLIDANALFQKLLKLADLYDVGYLFFDVISDEIDNTPTVDAVEVVQSLWIPVGEKLPDERESIFAKLYGTKSWSPGMFRTVSNTVLASIECEDGTRVVKAMHTQGGEWNLDSMPWAKEVTHWMPLPTPPDGVKMDGDGNG